MTFSRLRDMQRRGLTQEQARDALIEQKLEIDDIEKQLRIYAALLLWGRIWIPVLIGFIVLVLTVGMIKHLEDKNAQKEADILESRNMTAILIHSLENNDFEFCIAATDKYGVPGYRSLCSNYHAAHQQNPAICNQYLDGDQLESCFYFTELVKERPNCKDPLVNPADC